MNIGINQEAAREKRAALFFALSNNMPKRQ